MSRFHCHPASDQKPAGHALAVRSRGFSSTGMVMLLLLLGSLMLSGLHRQHSAQVALLSSERQAVMRFTQANGALTWAIQQTWRLGPQWQCRDAGQDTRACVLLAAAGQVVIAAESGGEYGFTLWRTAALSGQQLRPDPHGWADFCPLREAAKCALP